MEDERMERIEKTLDAVHQAVMRMETEHGERLEALFDGLQAHDTRFDRLEARMEGIETRMDGLDTRMGRIESEVSEIKAEVRETHRCLLPVQAMAEQHESRLQALEKQLRDHLEDHE